MPKFKVGGVEVGLPYAASATAALLYAGLAVASLAAPAIAQAPAHRAGSESEASTMEDRQILLQFSRCVVSRQRAQAIALLAADYTTDAYRDSLRRLTVAQHGCLPNGRGRLRFGGLLFAGDLAETMLPDMAPRGSLGARVALNPAAPPFRAREEGEVMSVCVVRAAPADTEALLATDQGSAGEIAAMQAITPKIGPCLANGASMRLNRQGVRALLALAAYRLVRHDAAASAAAAGN